MENTQRALDKFTHINLDSAYWAGFILSSGSLNKNYQKYLTISCKPKYISTLIAFCEFINIETEKIKNNSNLRINSKDLTDSLKKNFNLVIDKKLNFEPPELNNEICNKAFLKGLIEGKGSLFFLKNKLVYLSLNLNLDSYDFYRSKFNKWYGIDRNNISAEVRLANTRNLNMYRLKMSGKKASVILNDLHNLPTFRSPKWSIIDNHLYEKYK